MQLRHDAVADLELAQDWYEARRSGLGEEFVGEVRVVLRRIEANPEQFRERFEGVRRAPVRRFPFAIYYTIEVDEVTVIGILHNSRSPSAWKKRL